MMGSINQKAAKLTQLKLMAANLTRTVMMNSVDDESGIKSFKELKDKVVT